MLLEFRHTTDGAPLGRLERYDDYQVYSFNVVKFGSSVGVLHGLRRRTVA